jgi:hypothetical protein
MATFDSKGKLELTIFPYAYGVFSVIEKCLCVMFCLKPRIVHISKDDAYDDNNNVTKFIY